MTSGIFKKYKNFGILIAVRSDSKRLPGKHFKIINNKINYSVLDYCIKRCKNSKIKNIIICTSTSKNDDIFENYSIKHKIKLFRGSKNNVLKRHIDCAKKYNISEIIRITGDCPLIDKDIINSLLEIYINNDYDYVSNVMPSTFPDGLDVEIIKLSALKKSFSENNGSLNKEHVTLHIRKSKKYKKYNFSHGGPNLSKIRWTVDTENDLRIIKDIVKSFHPRIHFNWKDIYNLGTFNE